MLAIQPFAIGIFSLVTLFLAILVTLYKHWHSYWKKKGLNYIETTIPFGNAQDIFTGQQSFGETFKAWYLEMKKRGWAHGGAYFFGKPVYMAIDNDIVKKILISDFTSFPNHGFYIADNADPLTGHLFNMENTKWKNLRAKLPVAFTAAKMRQNVVVMEKISRILIKKLDEHAAAKKSVNIKQVVDCFATDIISACAFGVQTNTLNNENGKLISFNRAFFDEQWSSINNTIVLLVPRHILTMFNFKVISRKATNFFLNYFKDIKKHREKEKEKRNDLLKILLDLCDETKEHPDFNGNGKMEPLTFNELAAQMLGFFEAGFEPSATTISFAMFELACNPDIQDKLRNEIKTVLLRHDGRITYDAVNEMDYLDRVVDETLRKYPVLPVVARGSIKEYKVPRTDVTLDAGTFVMVSNWGIHYDPELYPDPEKFDPDRFLPENKAKRPFCSYLPFGEGPRICVGKRFGLWQTKIGLVSMVKNYKITLSEKTKLPLQYEKNVLVLKVQGDVWVDLENI